MNIFSIINNLYTNKKSDWIIDIDEVEIQPYVIQRWLVMNDRIRVQVRWLDKYVFSLSPKMYLSLVWSILPKTEKVPFVKYIKQTEEDQEFNFILERIRKHLKLADSDYNFGKSRIIREIKTNMEQWFAYYGIEKKYWKKYYLDFNKIKELGEQPKQAQKGLSQWGL